MGILKFIISLAAATAATAHNLRGSSTVSDCNPSSLFHYDSAALNPPNPSPNTNSTLSLTFTNSYSVVTDGIVDYAVNLNGLPYTYSEPLCTPNLKCPIELGQHTVFSEPINFGTLSGKLSIQANYKDFAGNSLVCVKTVVKLDAIENEKALAVRKN